MCDYVPGQLIVSVPRGDAGIIAVERLRGGQVTGCTYLDGAINKVSRTGASVWKLESLPTRFHLLKVPEGEEHYYMNSLWQRFSGPLPGGTIEAVQPNMIMSLAAAAPPPVSVDFIPDNSVHKTYLSMVNADDPFLSSYRGQNVKICVLDTGLAVGSPASAQVDASTSYDFVNDMKGAADDDYGHGSAVSWIINHVAPDAELRVLKVADKQGRATEWDTIAGVLSSYAGDVHLINASLQFGLGDTSCATCGRVSHNTKSIIFARCLSMLAATNDPPIVVAATGNKGKDEPAYPARYDDVVAVGSVSSSGERSSFSNYKVPHQNFFVAPGGESKQTKGTTDEFVGHSSDGKHDHAGTSMACAYATGVLALYRSVPSYRADHNGAFMDKVRHKADQTSPPNYTQDELGEGIIRFDP